MGTSTSEVRTYAGLRLGDDHVDVGSIDQDARADALKSRKDHLVERTFTLSKPAKMRFLARVWDRIWRGGSDYHAHQWQVADLKRKVEEHIDTLCQSDEALGPDFHLKRLEAFVALRDLAPTRHADAFQLDVNYSIHSNHMGADGIETIETTQLNYRLVIDGIDVVAGSLHDADAALVDAAAGEAGDGVPFTHSARENFLSFHRAMANTQTWSDTSLSPHYSDAILLKQLSAAMPDFRSPATASLAVKLGNVNRDPRFRGMTHAGIAEKMRILTTEFPEHRFMIHFTEDRDHYDLSVRPLIEYGSGAIESEHPIKLLSVGMSVSEREQLPALLIAEIKRATAQQLQEGETFYGASRESYISQIAHEMGGDRDAWHVLLNKREDPLYSHANLAGIQDHPETGTFTAVFIDDSHPNKPIVSNITLRGAALRERLNRAFPNLETVMNEAYFSARDQRLTRVLEGCHSAYLLDVDHSLSDEERAAVHQGIGDIVVGDTTLRALWKLSPPAASALSEAENPPRFNGYILDRPREWAAERRRADPASFFDQLV